MIRRELLATFGPDRDGLLRKVSELVDDQMLVEIARADWGEDVPEHLVELRKIRDTAAVPAPVRFCPQEVLELTRWSDSTASRPMQRRDHVMRAFACAALLRIKGEPGNADALIEGENATLAQLLASLDLLGGAYREKALQFLAWRLETMEDDDEGRPFFIYGLLLLALKTRTDLANSQLREIVDWLIEDEDRVRRAEWWSPYRKHADRWLLGLTTFDQRHVVWVATAYALRALAADAAMPPELRDLLGNVASLLTRDAGPWCGEARRNFFLAAGSG